jgi:short-subunit dehydrogenase
MVNISSIGGKMTFPLGSLYHGTKFAVEGISESLNYEMNQIGAKVKIVEPGMITTDFGGRSFDFQAGENLPEYAPIIGALMKRWQNPDNPGSPASLVAGVIYGAATDGSDQLRYRAGDDANLLLDSRKQMSDDKFTSMMKKQLEL